MNDPAQMPEADAQALQEVTITLTGWDAAMIDRIAEHTGHPVSNVMTAAFNAGLHRTAEVYEIPKIRVDRPWRRSGSTEGEGA